MSSIIYFYLKKLS